MVLPSRHMACPPRAQIRRMASAASDSRNSGRRNRGRLRSPSRADPRRRQRQSRSLLRRHGSPPERVERRGQDSNRALKRSRPEVFQSSTASCGGVCAVCLGCHDHSFAKCKEPKLWDGSANASRKGEQGVLVAANGLPLCFNWQIPRGCNSVSHPDRHRCSGCGRTDHGAQGCSRAQKT